jgi:feruloyl esterase
LNLIIGGPAVAIIFSTPPTSIGPDPNSAFDYATSFNLDRYADRIYATDTTFSQSSWEEISARSTDLDQFRAHGGKMIIPQGVSDPVFSISEILAWYRGVNVRAHDAAAKFVRVFPIPGMGHCSGGPATDEFDGFAALRSWVEAGVPPSRVSAKAGPRTPWPGRSRPLCPYPQVARYAGHGDSEREQSFVCK